MRKRDAACETTCDDHNGRDELGYVAWHEWSDRRSETHDQRRCDECGLFKIWVPKQLTTDPDASVIELLTLMADGAYVRSNVEAVPPEAKDDLVLAALFRALAGIEAAAQAEGQTVGEALAEAGLHLARHNNHYD